jgi:hypothetical protein
LLGGLGSPFRSREISVDGNSQYGVTGADALTVG